MEVITNYQKEVKVLQERLITLPDHQHIERSEIRTRLLTLLNEWNKLLNNKTTVK